MYVMKKDKAELIKEKYKMTYVSKITGLTQGYLSQILNGKSCSKRSAYCIAKAIEDYFEINDLFNSDN